MTAPKDIFLPPLNREIGSSHPINQVKAELTELLTSFGFSVAEGPEVETEEYNFDKLNIPATHPAREMHDTFYVNNKSQVLRTHTSPVQVRTMLESKPPIAVTLFCKFISPVIATLCLIFFLVSILYITIVIAVPAEGPSLFVAPSGQ